MQRNEKLKGFRPPIGDRREVTSVGSEPVMRGLRDRDVHDKRAVLEKGVALQKKGQTAKLGGKAKQRGHHRS